MIIYGPLAISEDMDLIILNWTLSLCKSIRFKPNKAKSIGQSCGKERAIVKRRKELAKGSEP